MKNCDLSINVSNDTTDYLQSPLQLYWCNSLCTCHPATNKHSHQSTEIRKPDALFVHTTNEATSVQPTVACFLHKSREALGKTKHLEEYYTTFMFCLLATDSPVISTKDNDGTDLQKEKWFSKIYILDKQCYPEKSDNTTQVLKILFNGVC
jgi:hypothetical protein